MVALKGVGIGLRREHHADILQTDRQVDWLEVITENFIDHGGHSIRLLDEVRERWPIGLHGVSMSFGGPDPLDDAYLSHIKALCDRLGAEEYSDHLCFSGAHGVFFADLLPLPQTHEAVAHVAERIRYVQRAIDRPVMIENISYYAEIPGSEMGHSEFVSRICEEADCGLLLDCNNVFVNSFNHGGDPLERMLALPLDRVGRIHLAGHKYKGEPPMAIDNHGSPVPDPVWDLYDAALAKTGQVPTLIEWDLEIPDLDRVLDERDKAAVIWERHGG